MAKWPVTTAEIMVTAGADQTLVSWSAARLGIQEV